MDTTDVGYVDVAGDIDGSGNIEVTAYAGAACDYESTTARSGGGSVAVDCEVAGVESRTTCILVEVGAVSAKGIVDACKLQGVLWSVALCSFILEAAIWEH